MSLFSPVRWVAAGAGYVMEKLKDRKVNTVLKKCLDLYSEEMQKILPEADDGTLLQCHLEFKNKAAQCFYSSLGVVPDENYELIIRNGIEEAFLDVVDGNWQQCESWCQEVLGRISDELFASDVPFSVSMHNEIEEYYNLMRNLTKEYMSVVGKSLHLKMTHVWMEYLEDRKQVDNDVLLDIWRRKQTQDPADESSNDAEVATASNDEDNSVLSEDKFKTRLWLQVIWGRVLLSWRYWTECRKETVQIILKLSQELDDDCRTENTKQEQQDELVDVDSFLERITRQDSLQFSNIINKDIRCYKVLLRLVQEFFDTLTTFNYEDSFGMSSEELMRSIVTFQSDDETVESGDCNCFRACERLLERHQEGDSQTARLLANSSRPLIHLRHFVQELVDEDQPLCIQNFTTVVEKLQLEVSEVTEMMRDSIYCFLKMTSDVDSAAQVLRALIVDWSPHRDEAIKQLQEIIDKLHKTSKDVAITNTVSSSVGVVGGIVAVVGLIMAPFTLGASLIPSAVAGAIISGAGAVTALGASVAEIIIDKDEMKKAETCLQKDKELFENVKNQIQILNECSSLLLRYIPLDELESFVSVITDPESTILTSAASGGQVDPRIPVCIARLVMVGGKAVAMPITRFVMAGTIAASRVAVLAVAHGIAAIGIALDIANLVISGVQLGQGAKSVNANKLEEVVESLQQEKCLVENCLNDPN